jgi:hypothetical protein
VGGRFIVQQETNFFPNPLSESEKLVLGMVKDSAVIVDAIRRSFLAKAATAKMFTSV